MVAQLALAQERLVVLKELYLLGWPQKLALLVVELAQVLVAQLALRLAQQRVEV